MDIYVRTDNFRLYEKNCHPGARHKYVPSRDEHGWREVLASYCVRALVNSRSIRLPLRVERW